jgi:very-short-patch-repair endonuclease
MRRIHPEIRSRARAMRKEQTPAEATLWSRLRDGRLNGLKFRRQHPIGPFIADFYYPAGKLVIELDGGGHLNQQEYDAARTDWLNSQGCRVLRFTNDEVRFRLDAVLEAIIQACQGDVNGGNF